MIAAVGSNVTGKRSPRKKIHQLRKQELARVHRRLQRESLEAASGQFQIDTTEKERQHPENQDVE